MSAELVATMRGKRYNASNRRARDELGWVPQVTLERSLGDTMQALQRRRGQRVGGRRPAVRATTGSSAPH